MKRFLSGLFVSILVVSVLIFYSLIRIDGTMDKYYLKFTTPKQNSLILGNSRTSRGLIPEILNEKLSQKFYNYSFNFVISPYGSSYLKSIKNKVDTTRNDGMFILAINPGIISFEYPETWDSTRLREKNGILNSLKKVNENPNFEYLLKYSRPINYLFEPKYELNSDGWLSFESPKGIDQKSIQEQVSIHARSQNLYVSEYRLSYLEKTITYLQQFGTVYLVRMPIALQMQKTEETSYPWVDTRVNLIATKLGVDYFNLFELDESFIYNDGSHLSIQSAKEVSEIVSDSIFSSVNKIIAD